MAKAMLPATFGDTAGEIMSADALREIDIFADVDPKLLRKFPGTVVKRTYRPGEVVCRQGEGGTTAFYILEGDVDIYIAGNRGGKAAAAQQSQGLLARIGGVLGIGAKASAHRKHSADKLVPIDANVDLRYGDLATTLSAGEVFGEMSCLNLAPRSATVRTKTPCVMLEMLRNMYEVLQRGETFRERMEANYRERALAGHLRNVPLFESLPPEAIEELCDCAELESFAAGEPIVREGDPSDSLYIIRLGQVKVTQGAAGGERTLAYLTRGDCFGEIGLLRGLPRTATVTGVDHPVFDENNKRRGSRAELVKINADDVRALLEKYPRIKGRLELKAEQRLREQRTETVTDEASSHAPRVAELGLLQGKNLMLIDLERCTRCDQCVDACVASHDDGVTRLIREGPRFDQYLVPSSCRMCVDPVCMIGCPVGSIRRGEDLNILIEDWCIGCEMCAKQCPYDSIQMHSLESLGQDVRDDLQRVGESGEVVAVTQQAAVCDQCASLPTGPACVYSCPHDAAIRVNASEFLRAGDEATLRGGPARGETK